MPTCDKEKERDIKEIQWEFSSFVFFCLFNQIIVYYTNSVVSFTGKLFQICFIHFTVYSLEALFHLLNL